MPSTLELTNRVLSELGKSPVEAVTNSEASIVVANKLDELYKEVLLETMWNFAIGYREDYSYLSVNYNKDHSYSYQLPGNFGRFYKFGRGSPCAGSYEFIDGMLLTNVTPVRYYYIRNDVPFEVWPPLPARTLVLYAASKLAPTLTNNIQLTGYLAGEYERIKVRAILENDMDRSVTTTPFNDFDRFQLI